jgi:hypothetical protein
MVRRVVLLLAITAPVLVLATVDAASLLIATVTDHPRWRDPHLNLSEAAAVRDHAEVVRLIERGENPNGRQNIRPGLVGNDTDVTATPLEAAVSIRRPELMDLLFARGAMPSAADWTRLRCAAQARGYGDIVENLDRHAPAGAEPKCAGDEAFWVK